MIDKSKRYTLILSQIYFHFIDIFASFDHDFAKYKNPAHFLTLSMG